MSATATIKPPYFAPVGFSCSNGVIYRLTGEMPGESTTRTHRGIYWHFIGVSLQRVGISDRLPEWGGVSNPNRGRGTGVNPPPINGLA